MGIFPGSNQDHHGCVSKEFPASGGILPGVRPENINGEQVPREVSGARFDAGLVVGGEGVGMASFGVHHGGGGRKSPADRLHGPVEVPP